MTSPQPEGAEEPKPGGASEAQDAEAGNEDGQPQEVTRYVHEAMAMIAGPALNPLLNKLGPEHLSKAMDHSHDLEKEEAKTRRSGRWFQLGYVLLAAAVFVFLTIYLHQIGQPVTFPGDHQGRCDIFGGSGVGYGYARHRSRRSESSDR